MAAALRQIKFAKTGYILISVLFYISGVTCMMMPSIDTKPAVTAGGVILIAYGVIKITGYLSKDLYCLAFQYDFACGLFLIVLGMVVLIAGSQGFEGHFLSELGVLVLLDSLLSIQTAIDAKNFGLSSWQIILAASILSGVLGAALIVTGVQQVAGLSLLAEGFMRHYIVHCTVYLSPEYHPSPSSREHESTKAQTGQGCFEKENDSHAK